MGKKKRELTPMADGRWRKKYQKKIYYFRGDYQSALTAWKAKKKEIDDAPLLANLQALLAMEAAHQSKVTIGNQADMAPPMPNGVRILPDDLSFLPHREYVEIQKQQGQKVETVGEAVEAFLKRKKDQLELGQIVAGRFDGVRRNVYYFRDFVGKDRPVADVNGKTLDDYHAHLAIRVKRGESSPAYAKVYIVDMKQFLQWAYQVELIPTLPRNFNSRTLSFQLPVKAVPVFSDEQVKTILAATSGAFRLYLLLMLNCGMTQKDISDLKQTEVDWEQGRIIRKRSKTANYENVPEVNYRLWKETFDLLKIHRSNDPEHVLRSETGGDLKTEYVEDGKLKKSDPIAQAFFRLKQKLDMAEGSLKLFRKTAPSKLAEHPVYGRFTRHFLGHSPRTVAEKHYEKPPQGLFDEAVKWLGEQFGIE